MSTTLGDRLKAWRTLEEGLKPRLEEVPFLKDDHTELAALVDQIDSLLTQSDVYEGRLREAVRQRALAEDRIADLYGRMVFRLKGTYGKRANVLHELGLRPDALPGPPRKEEPKPAPAPAAAEEPTREST
ncbi:MAG TPA: hypothetical protein VF121_19135 [Thermoanaerobaculia bacterium]|nr:hypothetical protein [Thermoanaerobaculia bacterium]